MQRFRGRTSAITLTALLLCSRAYSAEWLRGGLNTNVPLWGLKGALQFALYPGGFGGGHGGPRGLIRLGYPILTNAGYALVNFIAIEPIVDGRRGLSELEASKLDHTQGKRFWSDLPHAQLSPEHASIPLPAPSPGELLTAGPEGEELRVQIKVEPFDNGAHVALVIAQSASRPDEIRITVQAEPDSAPMDYCILTATMGNMARARLLWLKDAVISSAELYPHFQGTGFAPHAGFPLNRLYRAANGDPLVAITTDEAEPATVFPFPGTKSWHYGGYPVTQYWRKPADQLRDDLRAIVNARYTYWQSQRPVPGGVAFENFELQEHFFQGQTMTFGITRRTPAELGFRPPAARG